MNKATRLTRLICSPSVFVLVFLTYATAQEPRVVNSKLQQRSAKTGLEKEFRALVGAQAEPAWVAYAVPMVSGEHHMCCYDSWQGYNGCCGNCRLEGDHDNFQNRGGASSVGNGPVKLEGPSQLIVLFRVEQKRVGKIRTFSEDCELDAGGLAFYWLTGARPGESVALLSSFVTSSSEENIEEDSRVGRGALTAIAFHADASADTALQNFVSPSRPEKLREKAAFWLGSARGRSGYEILRRMVREDPSDRVRDKAVFALSVSKVPEAVDAMMDVARNDKSAQVRSQALFWLGHKAGKKAASAITEAIENDPDTTVKKRAVFALSQLPKEEGVPMLIQVARTNRNPAVRKQAMFWLGQSRDPRALDFFQEVLKSSN